MRQLVSAVKNIGKRKHTEFALLASLQGIKIPPSEGEDVEQVEELSKEQELVMEHAIRRAQERKRQEFISRG